MTSLLDLPRELRDRIYFFAMDELPTRFLILPETNLSLLVLNPNILPNLAFACRQLHLETFLAYLLRTRFILGTTATHPYSSGEICIRFHKFLSLFPHKQALNAIRMLTFSTPMGSWDPLLSPTYADTRYPGTIARACPGLQRLSIRFEAQLCLTRDFLINGNGDDDFGPLRLKTKEELETVFHFSRSLFRMGRLRRLRISLEVDGFSRMDGIERDVDVYRNLLQLIYEGFGKERLRTLKVDVDVAQRRIEE